MSELHRGTPAERSDDVNASEFNDYHGPLLPRGFAVDLSRLFTSESLRGAAAIVVAILVMQAPGRSPRTLAVLLGIILVAWAFGGFAELAKKEARTTFTVLRVAFLVLAGTSFLLFEDFTGESLGQVLGAFLLAGGIVTGYRALRSSQPGSRFEPTLGAIFYIALGAALLAAPLSILGLAVLVLSVYWFLTGLVTVVTNIRLDDRQVEPSNTWQMLLDWIQGRPNTADDRQQLYEKIFYEGSEQARRLSRYFVLMGLATAIAAFGIIADSTAVVIGAMLVAPLMTPLMGTALSMTMGWPRRAIMSGSVALGGVLLAIGLSIVFGWVYGPDVSSVSNSQVASRIAPTLVDLMIAVAAGGAGAFALSRPDVSDSLPGVAVAIALVPPLAVVGLMLSQADWGAASGAVLLFLTNLVAILLVGGTTFILTGVVPLLRMAQNASWRFRSLGMVAILAIAVIALLGVSAESFRRQTAGLERASNVVDVWLAGTDLEVVSAVYADDEYQIVLSGADDPPSIGELAEAMKQEFDESIPLDVTWVPSATFSFEP